MSKKDDNIEGGINRHLIKQFYTIYEAKKQHYWSEEEFESILKFCFDNQKIEMARYALSLAVKYYPDNTDYHYFYGKYYLQTEKFDKALVHFQKFFWDDPANDFVVFEMAFCWEVLGKKNEAIKVLKDYLQKIDTESQMVWHALGTIYLSTNDFDNAMEAFEFSLALDPDNLATYYYLGNIYCIKEQYDKAFMVYSEILKYDDDMTSTYANLCECCFYLEDYDKVLEYAKKAIELDKDTAYVLYFVSKVYLKDEEYDMALDYVNKAIEQEPDISEFFSLKGHINVCMGIVSEAEKAFIEAVNYDELLFECYLDLASFYVQENRAEEAIDIVEKNLHKLSDIDYLQGKYLLSACNYAAGRKQEAYSLFLNVDNNSASVFNFLYEHFADFVEDPIIVDYICNITSEA